MNGSWSEFPELIRKVKKHAAQQTTLIHTATAEHYVATHSSSRPTTSPAPSQNPVDTLQQTLQRADDTLSEETFQGQSCLAWANWTGTASTSTDAIHLSDVVPLFDRYGQKSTSTCTKICLVKAVFIQGRSYVQKKEVQQARFTHNAATAWIELNLDLVRSTQQLAYWSEQILSSFIVANSDSLSSEEKLKVLRLWSALTAKTQEVSPSTYGNLKSHVSRNFVWQIYYHIISHELTQPQRSSSIPRARQAAELRAVETAYETNFLRNRKFPKATESNAPVEEWVEQVIRNWQVLCGPDWHENDLGQGGRDAVTRNVLDVLYRAATKTFHSTLILRRLFQVHKSLTEFELAYKCLDTYIELTDRSRARSAKSGDPDPNQDADEIILLVVAEGVEGLAAYGGQKEAHKAYDLATKLEDWLEQTLPEEFNTELQNGHNEASQANLRTKVPLPDVTLQVVYRAIGIAKAHWSSWTPFSESRSELQTEALAALQRACKFSEPQLSTLYALAVLFAETRDISQAIRYTKLALQRIAQSGSMSAAREECAFWHLMTLLLTSQQDFETALQSSAATLDDILGLTPESRNGSVNGSVAKHPEKLAAYAADDVECDDLQKVVELQISYLALVELMDGADAALNHSNELLSLYSTLFRRFGVGDIKSQLEQSQSLPQTSASTVKSVKGSIFSRRKHDSPSIAPSTPAADSHSPSQSRKAVRPTTQASQAPAIHVTDESGKSPTKKHGHHLVHRSHHDKTTSKSSNQVSAEPHAASVSAASNHKDVTKGDNDTISTATTGMEENTAPISTQHDTHSEAKQPLGEVPHNVQTHQKAPPPVGHSRQPPEQDVRLPTVNSRTSRTSPIPRFPKVQAQKHALVVLTKTWLTVATLYRRSHMFEDAREACEEAAKVATKIEALVSATDPSARVLAEAGWGGGNKSSDEVWADVCCTKAELLGSILTRREDEGQEVTGESMREVVEQYEQCLMYYPDHAGGIIGLSNILLDYYEKKVDLAKKVDDGRPHLTRPVKEPSVIEEDILGPTTPSQEHLYSPFPGSETSNEDLRKTPENLNRIAARDRAYGLLSTLTKLGNGWDNSEAWFALARAQELGGEFDKAKDILWWCIELEDTRPIRHWRNLGCGGYVL